MANSRIRPLALKDVAIGGAFWSRYTELVRSKVIDYQWEVLNDRVDDAPRSSCIKNFEIAAGRDEGEFYGMVFQDSDLYKWLECVAYSLEAHPDKALEELADGVIELIGAAQGADGYINTYYTIKEPKGRWKNLHQGHELYCAGHLIEAAVAYYSATGKRAVLDIVIRFADYIDSVFGLEDGKMKGYPGHQEIELALYKLYEVTAEKRYLNLAAYFIKQRGAEPYYFEAELEDPGYVEIFNFGKPIDRTYSQSHARPADQRVATGHSVRAVYMYSAMADLAAETGDAELAAACDALYEDVTTKQMYITGAIGAAAWGERFTTAYDLPNNLIYGETCASVGLMMFARRMNVLNGGAEYIDVMERALYNTVLAGMSLAGTEFYYVNPLEVDPVKSAGSHNYRHVKPVRQKWFACACCPANLARTVMGLGLYAYAADDDGVYVNLYCQGEAKNGQRKVEVETAYPFGNTANITVTGGRFKLHLRNPQMAPIHTLTINDENAEIYLENGYIVIERDWQGDKLCIQFDMTPRHFYSDVKVQSNVGKAAVMRGPIVYCMEEVDNGPLLGSYVLGDEAGLKEAAIPKGLLPEGVALSGPGYKYKQAADGLYGTAKPTLEPSEITLIPYFMWANRGANEMRVYVNAPVE